VRAAARGAVVQVRLMLACGFPPDLIGESGATALQQAAWRGQAARFLPVNIDRRTGVCDLR